MANKGNRNQAHGNAAVEEQVVAEVAQVVEAPVTEQAAAVETPVAGPNYRIDYRRDHPGNRCSYGIAGVSGIVVFDKGLFAGGIAPASISFDCEMAQPKLDNKTAKAEAAAAKLAAKAQAAAEKLKAQQVKIEEKARKAQEALEKAKARIAAAQPPVAAPAVDAPAV